MKTYKSLAIIIFPMLFISCERNSDPVVENSNMDLLSKIVVDGELVQEYSYNDRNLVTEEKSKYFYTGHLYDENNRVIRSDFYLDPGIFSSNSETALAAMNRTEWVDPSNSVKSLTQEFEYDKNNNLLKKYYIRLISGYSDWITFTYDNGRISRQTSYYEDKISQYTDFFYDQSGNLIREELYVITSADTAEHWTTREYEFDNMKNPYFAFRFLVTPGKNTNPNNIVKETYTILFDVDDTVEKVQVTEYAYEYNDRGYPVKVNEGTEYLYH